MGVDREAAVGVVEEVLGTVEDDLLPVPVREVWVYGDVALGLDPVRRLDIYLTKDILMRGEEDADPEALAAETGVKGVGTSVRAAWAEEHPEYLRANENGYAAPERCLAAHLLDGVDAPVHLEVCNASFEDNVTQRLEGAQARDAYGQILDPRGACLWADGTHSEDALEKLHTGSFVMPTLPEALEMLGMDPGAAEDAADVLQSERATASGTSVRGDVV